MVVFFVQTKVLWGHIPTNGDIVTSSAIHVIKVPTVPILNVVPLFLVHLVSFCIIAVVTLKHLMDFAIRASLPLGALIWQELGLQT